MAMLENHMVLVGPDQHDDLLPDHEDSCAICGKTAFQIDGDWFEDWHLDEDEGAYVAGDDELRDAADTPMGLVCSKACRSEAMYRAALPEEKEALDAVRDACLALREHGELALRLVKEKMDGSGPGISGFEDFLSDIQYEDVSWDA